jgi:hypothetical protein
MRDWLASALSVGIDWAVPDLFALLAFCTIATAIAVLVAMLGVNFVVAELWATVSN